MTNSPTNTRMNGAVLAAPDLPACSALHCSLFLPGRREPLLAQRRVIDAAENPSRHGGHQDREIVYVCEAHRHPLTSFHPFYKPISTRYRLPAVQTGVKA